MMKTVSKLLMLLVALPLCWASCSDDDTVGGGAAPEGETDGQTEGGGETPDPVVPQYEGFEGYMFVLEQSQIPNLGGYEPDRTAPQAKLMYMSPEREISTDVFAGQDVELGFDCKFEKTDGHFVVFAKKETLADDHLVGKATVIEGKTLKVVSQTSYSFDQNMEPDFVVAVSPERGCVGFGGHDIFSLDLKSGRTQSLTAWDYDRNVGGVGFGGRIFLFAGNAVNILSGVDGQKEETVSVGKTIRRVYNLNGDHLLIRTPEETAFVFSLKERRVKYEFAMPEILSWEGAVLDEEHNLLYMAGVDSRRDKVYTITLGENTPEPKLFYTIPASDINKGKVVTGAIRMGINPDTRDLYLGHVADLVIVGQPGARRSSRAGYLSRISLAEHDGTEALTDPDEKIRIGDMFLFSPMLFLGK